MHNTINGSLELREPLRNELAVDSSTSVLEFVGMIELTSLEISVSNLACVDSELLEPREGEGECSPDDLD